MFFVCDLLDTILCGVGLAELVQRNEPTQEVGSFFGFGLEGGVVWAFAERDLLGNGVVGSRAV